MSPDNTTLQARVTRHVDALPEQVFAAWLSPELIGRWMFGPALRDEEVVRIALDARVGGTFSFVVRRQGQEIDHVGEYLEIDRPRRLAFTWGVMPSPDRSRVIVDFTPTATGSEVTLTHELSPEWADFVSRSQEAWGKMLDALARMLAE